MAYSLILKIRKQKKESEINALIMVDEYLLTASGLKPLYEGKLISKYDSDTWHLWDGAVMQILCEVET